MAKKKTQNTFVKHPVSSPADPIESDLENPLVKHRLSEHPLAETPSVLKSEPLNQAISDAGLSPDSDLPNPLRVDRLSNTPLKSIDDSLVAPSSSVDEDWTIHNILRPHSGFGDATNAKILDYLSNLDLLPAPKVKKIREASNDSGFDLVDFILKNQFMTEAEIGQVLAAFFNKPYVSFRGINIPVETLMLIPKEVSRRSGVVAYEDADGVLKVAMVNPADTHLTTLLAKKTGKKIEIHYTTPSQVEQASRLYPSEFHAQLKDILVPGRVLPLDQLAQLFDSLILFAFQRGASDVHIEPFEKEVRIRFRIDGVLHTIATLPKGAMETAVNHIKVLAHLRIDTHSASQDGRFKMAYEKTTINFRVSIMPTYHGEKVVLRLLTSEMQDWTLADLGYQAGDQGILEKGIAKSNGMILVTGPTGSGKTTTLYALLKILNQEGINLSTIEDPIEYGLPGIVQIQVNPLTNITYAEGLKSLMRQDPDVLMIGEIRDFETGKIAVNAALTGHLVLSTLHTNNASLAPLRLLQMGVDPYLVVTTVNLIVAQRLARKICNGCMTSYTLTAKELDDIQKRIGLSEAQAALFKKYFGKAKGEKARLYKGAGCELCNDSGYHGRTVIAETLKLKDNIRELILKSRPESEIEAVAIQNGMVPLFEDGLKKAIQGVTTLEEVLRVINQ